MRGGEEIWVTEQDGAPAALMVLVDGWIDQLYVAPAAQRRGHGAALLAFAQSRHAELSLWSFVSNRDARALYVAHGFTPVGPPASDNEENAPALRYRWRRSNHPRRDARRP